VPATALQHFQEDISRATAIVTHAEPLPTTTAAEQMLRSDLLRSAWMFAVGGLDAYFCDAYTDIVAATIISKSRHNTMILPDFFYNIQFPVRAILEPYAVNVNWKWRMAARKMMERKNVLSLEEIQKLFNKFFRKGHRFYADLLDSWITHPQSSKRLFGVTQAAYTALAPADKDSARKIAQERMDKRYGLILQRRHDCIHNCDRPKVSPQLLVKGDTVVRVIEDVEFLVNRCDEHINAEFRQFLLDARCSATIVGQAGY
jgi:hypothetical protein